MEKTLRALSYGGRTPSDVAPGRLEALENAIPIFAAGLQRASTLSLVKESAKLRF
jgi:hypothetical protein